MLMWSVGAKSTAHLIKFHLLQWEVKKVKFLVNSNMTRFHDKVKITMTRSKVKSRSDHDVAHLHPLTYVPIEFHIFQCKIHFYEEKCIYLPYENTWVSVAWLRGSPHTPYIEFKI